MVVYARLRLSCGGCQQRGPASARPASRGRKPPPSARGGAAGPPSCEQQHQTDAGENTNRHGHEQNSEIGIFLLYIAHLCLPTSAFASVFWGKAKRRLSATACHFTTILCHFMTSARLPVQGPGAFPARFASGITGLFHLIRRSAAQPLRIIRRACCEQMDRERHKHDNSHRSTFT
jgi:hypothetical protein